MFFDTGIVEPGKRLRLFGIANVGDRDNCNIQVAGSLAPDNTFVVTHVAARLLGLSKEEEKVALSYLRFDFIMGDRPQLELSGPCLSTLLDGQPRGFELKSPVVVPVRQNVHVAISAEDELMVPVKARYYIFGLQTRDVA